MPPHGSNLSGNDEATVLEVEGYFGKFKKKTHFAPNGVTQNMLQRGPQYKFIKTTIRY